MANQDLAEKKPSALSALFEPVREYFRETAGELRKVHWPTPQEARNLTAVVMAVMFVMAIFLGLFDFLFERLMLEILRLSLIAIAVAVAIVLSILVVVFFPSRERRY
ncbi:MAG: preprotein translocase subunit SecE [Thermoflexales bacterium]|nr:preprotein translocase subunit SecE [Thermoflexales bacterium]MCX7939495.1 preprotein translocase subunit SecE [Thermoflexales bacterium]MDW8053814.1 preprotein translocase subunit SecE [Anaerolineae bacterium]MDW8293066.1 preprotein translocase subunit SecE [Anaerolineae bacterium]